MFARTKRLTLRPGWPEDAPALSRAIGHESVVSNLSRVPWPYALGDAETFLARTHRRDEAVFVILAHDGRATQLIGGIGIHGTDDGGHELGYWLTPGAWGRGYATEAGRAVVDIARYSLGLASLRSAHFVDNPASGRVLTKLGFRATGRIEPRHSHARSSEASCALLELALEEDRSGHDPVPMAA